MAMLKYISRSLLRLSLVAVLFMLLLAACQADVATNHRSYFVLDTLVTVTIYGDVPGVDDTQNVIKQMCDNYDALFSPTAEGSDVARLNQSCGKPIRVSTETAEVIKRALYYSDLTDGAFDITTESASRLYSFSQENPVKPTEEQLSKAVEKVGYKRISIEGNTVTLNDCAINLNSIAKGYIADKIAEYLSKRGAYNAIVDLGGNVLTLGTKNGRPFAVGVQKPFAKRGELVKRVMAQQHTAVVTAGSYERYFYDEDNLYHHILNPSDGKPVNNELHSVTIITKSATAADALTTACFVMGAEKSKKLIKSFGNAKAVFCYINGQIENYNFK